MSSNLYVDVDPVELTGYARAVVEEDQSTQALSAWMPNTLLDDIEWQVSGADNPVLSVAPFRTYDTEAPIAARQWAHDEMRGRMAPISQKRRVQEYDQLRLRQLDQRIREAAFDDARKLALEVSARINLARGEIMNTGSLVINENGVDQTIDFGRNANREVTVGTLWSDTATSDPLGDLLTAQADYRTLNGFDPGYFVMSTAVYNEMIQSDTLRSQVISANEAALTRATNDQIDNARNAYGLAAIVINDEGYNQASGFTRVLDESIVMLMPETNVRIGATFYGTTLEADSIGLVGSEAPGIVAVAEETSDPIQLWTKAAAISMPVLASPDLTYALTVS